MISLKKNKFIAILLVTLMILPLFTNNYVLAEKEQKYDIEEIKVIIMENLALSGLTDDEIDFLIQENPITAESIENGLLTSEQYDSPVLLTTPGSKKTTTVNITKAFVEAMGYGVNVGTNVAGWGLSKVKWTNVIIKAVGWKSFIVGGVAAGTAAACMKYYLSGYKGVKLTINWTWMYGDQSMVYFWGITGLSSVRYK